MTLKIGLGGRSAFLILVYRRNCFLQECPRLKQGKAHALLAEAVYDSVAIVPKPYHAIAQVPNSTAQIRFATWNSHPCLVAFRLPLVLRRMLSTRRD